MSDGEVNISAIRPVIVNPSFRLGGSAVAAYRLFRGLRAAGVDATYIIAEKGPEERGVVSLAAPLDRIMIKLAKGLEKAVRSPYSLTAGTAFSSAWIGSFIGRRIRESGGNVLHVHQITNGLMPAFFPAIANLPFVWTMHDWWAATGGCHVPDTCTRYRSHCGRCPILRSRRELDLSRLNFALKKRLYSRRDIEFTAVSAALKQDMERASILARARIAVVPNGLNLDVMHPIAKPIARSILGLPATARIVLFGASTSVPNKGFGTLREVCRHLGAATIAGCMAVLFGDASVDPKYQLGIPFRCFGSINNDTMLALLYSSADVTLVPSRVESFGLVAAESLACGTPVIAYKTGGLVEIVDHNINGFLVEAGNTDQFVRTVDHIIRLDAGTAGVLATEARKKALISFDIRDIAARYMELYRRVIAAIHPSGS